MKCKNEVTVKIRAEKNERCLKEMHCQNNVFIYVYNVFILDFRNVLNLLYIYFTFVDMKSKTIWYRLLLLNLVVPGEYFQFVN